METRNLFHFYGGAARPDPVRLGGFGQDGAGAWAGAPTGGGQQDAEGVHVGKSAWDAKPGDGTPPGGIN